MSNENNNNSNAIAIEQNGGMTRITHGAPSQATASPVAVQHEASRVSQGPIRLDMHTGQMTQHGVAKYTVGQDRDTSSVSATLQRVNGQDTVELIPGLPASRTNIKQAIADGLIEPVGPGLWRDKGTSGASTGPAAAAAAANPAAAAAGTQQADAGAGVFDPEDDAAWNADIEPLSQSGYDTALAGSTVAILSGADGLDKVAERLAESEGMSIEQAQQYTEGGYGMYEGIVAREVTKAGLDPAEKESFYAWVREHKGKALQNALQELTMARNVKPWVHLAHEYRTRATKG
jgi:hypothetical protein